jgi:hypothetical protein
VSHDARGSTCFYDGFTAFYALKESLNGKLKRSENYLNFKKYVHLTHKPFIATTPFIPIRVSVKLKIRISCFF